MEVGNTENGGKHELLDTGYRLLSDRRALRIRLCAWGQREAGPQYRGEKPPQASGTRPVQAQEDQGLNEKNPASAGQGMTT